MFVVPLQADAAKRERNLVDCFGEDVVEDMEDAFMDDPDSRVEELRDL